MLPRERPRPRRSRPTGPWRSPGRPARRSTSSTCRAPRRSAHVAEARASGVRATAETCPHYLALTDARYDEPDPLECAKSVISPPLRPAADRDALWAGLAAGDLSLVATDHVPDRVAVEKGEAARGVPFDKISNGAPGIETLLAVVYGEGVATGGSRSSGWSTCSRRRPPAGSGSHGRARSRSAATPTSSCSTRRPDGRSGPGRPPPHERLHAVRGHRGRRRRPERLRPRPGGHP